MGVDSHVDKSPCLLRVDGVEPLLQLWGQAAILAEDSLSGQGTPLGNQRCANRSPTAAPSFADEGRPLRREGKSRSLHNARNILPKCLRTDGGET